MPYKMKMIPSGIRCDEDAWKLVLKWRFWIHKYLAQRFKKSRFKNLLNYEDVVQDGFLAALGGNLMLVCKKCGHDVFISQNVISKKVVCTKCFYNQTVDDDYLRFPPSPAPAELPIETSTKSFIGRWMDPAEFGRAPGICTDNKEFISLDGCLLPDIAKEDKYQGRFGIYKITVEFVESAK